MKKVVSAVSVLAVCLSCLVAQVGQAAEPSFAQQFAGVRLAKSNPRTLPASRFDRLSVTSIEPAADESLTEKLFQRVTLSIAQPEPPDKSSFARDLYPYGFGEDCFDFALKGFGHKKLHQVHFCVISRYWVYGSKAPDDWIGGFSFSFRLEPKIKANGFSYR